MKEKLSLFAFTLISIVFVFEETSAFELSPGMGYLKAQRKIICSMQDNKPIVYWWYGRMYSRVQGEKDKLLFKVEGMNIRQCDTVKDSKRGNGYRMVSRELLFYQDPESGEILDQWTNPWTGETVDVLHVANDPVNWGYFYERDEEGKPLTISDLTNDNKDTAKVGIGWERISYWLPWMKMSGRDGIVYFHTFGKKLNNYDELPDSIKKEIETNYPKYNKPPPTDDDRRNETSWTYFKKVLGNQ